jgi:LCP family protein required for cell wall assembly
MFEHLDDPAGFQPDAGFRSRVVAGGRSRRRRRIAAGTAAATVLALVATVAGALTAVDHKLDRVPRVDVESIGPGEPAPGKPQTILFAGIDSDAGISLEDPTRDPGLRSDTIIVARVDPAAHVLTVLPIPRDLWVPIPGHPMGRINTALQFGGPDLLVQTVEAFTGVQVDHYVSTTFRGAVDIGDALGGLRLQFDHPMRDTHSGFRVRNPGCITLDGLGLLQLARSRHMQQVGEDGFFHSDPTSDLGRIERQQAIALALLRRVSEVDTRDPRELVRLLDAATRSLVVDSAMSNRDLVAMVRAVAGSEVRRVDVPVTDVVHGGAAVLDPTGDLTTVRTAINGGPPAPPAGPDGVASRAIVPQPC